MPNTPPSVRRRAASALCLLLLPGVALATACAADPTVTGPRIPGTDPAPDAQPTRTLAPPGHGGSTVRPAGSNGSTGSTGPAGSVPAAAATIESFSMPSTITCHGTVDVEVEARYATRGASAVVFVVDGVAVNAGTGRSGASGTAGGSGGSGSVGSAPTGSTSPRADASTSGTYLVPLHCDGSAHTVVLTAIDANGRTVVESRAVLTDTNPAGD